MSLDRPTRSIHLLQLDGTSENRLRDKRRSLIQHNFSKLSSFHIELLSSGLLFALNFCFIPTPSNPILYSCRYFLGPVPERPFSANPGLKFCSIFVFYLLMHCLK